MSLRETVALMRELGILHYKDKDVEIVLGPKPDEDEKGELEPLNKPVNSGKLGKDGLTAVEQRRVYGSVMDAEE